MSFYKVKFFVISFIFYYLHISNCYFDAKIKEEVEKKISAETPQWIIEQITSDFKDNLPIDTEMIDKTFDNYTGRLARFTITDSSINVHFNKQDSQSIVSFVANWVKELNDYVALPNVDFLIALDDEVKIEQCFVPVMGFCKKKGEKNILLIPDYQIFHTLQLERYFCFVDYDILSKVKNGISAYSWA